MARKATTAPADVQTHSIPNAVRPAAAPSGDDLFDSLGEDGAVTVKAPGQKNRPEMPIPATPSRKRSSVSSVPPFSVKCSGSVRELSEAGAGLLAIFGLWKESLYKNGTQPANPSLKEAKDGKPDMEAMWQVQDKFTKNNIHLPEPKAGETLQQAAIRLLVELGLPQDAATAFITNEVDMRPQKGLKTFNELKFGHYEGEGKKQWVDAHAG